MFFKDSNEKVLIEDGNGTLIEYYPSGSIRSVNQYTNGRVEGKFYELYPQGDTSVIGFYDGENKVKEWKYWHLNGLPSMQMHYTNLKDSLVLLEKLKVVVL